MTTEGRRDRVSHGFSDGSVANHWDVHWPVLPFASATHLCCSSLDDVTSLPTCRHLRVFLVSKHCPERKKTAASVVLVSAHRTPKQNSNTIETILLPSSWKACIHRPFPASSTEVFAKRHVYGSLSAIKIQSKFSESPSSIISTMFLSTSYEHRVNNAVSRWRCYCILWIQWTVPSSACAHKPDT